MPITVSLTQDAIQTALGNFLEAILPAGTPVIMGQGNRVPEPKEDNFVIMNMVSRPRLGTNVDSNEDVLFTASIAVDLLTVTAVEFGTIEIGATVFGTGLASGTALITGFITGSLGGTGVYSILPVQGVISGQQMAAGGQTLMQPTETIMQCDFYGARSANDVQIATTIFRDGAGVDLLEGTGLSPLFCDEPMQMAFIDGESQYEDRWTVKFHMQVDPTVRLPQQFAGALDLEVINVEAADLP